MSFLWFKFRFDTRLRWKPRHRSPSCGRGCAKVTLRPELELEPEPELPAVLPAER